MGGLCSKANIAILEREAITAVKKIAADPDVVAAVEKAVTTVVTDIKTSTEAADPVVKKVDDKPKADDEPKADNEPKAAAVNTVV
jgi:hypothetical protein